MERAVTVTEHSMDVEKNVVISQVSCLMGQALYLGGKKSDSLCRMPGNCVVVNFFNNM